MSVARRGLRRGASAQRGALLIEVLVAILICAFGLLGFAGMPTGSTLAGGGLPPTPVSGIVSIGTGASAKKVVFVIGAPNPKNSGIEGSRVNPVIKVPRSRIYWYQEVNR